MKTYGIFETKELISIPEDDNGNLIINALCPKGKYQLNDFNAPWVMDETNIPDPDLLWTPPALIAFTKLIQPEYDSLTQIVEPILVWTETNVTRDWIIRNLTEAEITIINRKIWKNSQAFLAEFSLSEIAQISISTSPTIAALRFILSTWSGEIFSDDERVVTGLDAIQSAEIINAIRRIEILKK